MASWFAFSHGKGQSTGRVDLVSLKLKCASQAETGAQYVVKLTLGRMIPLHAKVTICELIIQPPSMCARSSPR